MASQHWRYDAVIEANYWRLHAEVVIRDEPAIFA